MSRMSCLTALLAVVLTSCSIGCGGGSDPKANTTKNSENPVLSGKEQVKQRLKAVADTGSGGSALGGVREALLELKKTESALADQLLSQLAEMEQTGDAEKLKQMANDMISKL